MHPFYQIKNFAEVISAASRFMSHYRGLLLKVIAWTALPIIILAFTIGSRFFNHLMDYLFDEQEVYEPSYFYGGSSPSLFSFNDYALQTIGLLLLGALVLIGVVIAVVRYIHDHPETTEWEVKTIFKYNWPRIPRFIGALILLGSIIGLLFTLFVFTYQVEGAAFSLIMTLLIGSCLYFGIPIYLYLPATFHEKTNLFSVFSRCFYLASGYWWSSFGIIFVSFLLLSLLSYPLLILSSLPYDFFMELTLVRFEPMFDVCLIIVRTFVFLFSGIFLTLVGTFQYYNLVAIKDGLGLLQRIEEIGS